MFFRPIIVNYGALVKTAILFRGNNHIYATSAIMKIIYLYSSRPDVDHNGPSLLR